MSARGLAHSRRRSERQEKYFTVLFCALRFSGCGGIVAASRNHSGRYWQLKIGNFLNVSGDVSAGKIFARGEERAAPGDVHLIDNLQRHAVPRMYLCIAKYFSLVSGACR
jgi:hypothetical protein